jgi:SAM-dependent methyltransferase
MAIAAPARLPSADRGIVMSTPNEDETRAHWDEHYGAEPQIWSGRPNGILVDEAADLEPGTALDLGCGEGADAIWLAERGWQVTAVDVSRTALDRASAAAAEAGVDGRIVWQQVDLARGFPSGTYDLVSAQYLHSKIEFPRDEVLRAAAAAVAPGGTLLVVGHAAAPPWARHHHDHEEFPLPTADAAAMGLEDDDWTVEICEIRERDTMSPRGEPATISDSIVNARRRQA